MKKDWKYVSYLLVAFGLFAAVKLTSRQSFDWTPTYDPEDKNPFGAYTLLALAGPMFSPHPVSVSHETLYEQKDSLRQTDNLLVLTHAFQGDKEDTEVLLSLVHQGATVIISAQRFSGKFADTLRLETSDSFFESIRSDSAYLRFTGLDDDRRFYYRMSNMTRHFSSFDSAHTTVIAVNSAHDPVSIRTTFGSGSFILNCTPLAFTNIYTLQGHHHEFVSHTLSYFPARAIHWAAYYSTGRREAGTPLRFILRQPPLAWAYYLVIVSLMLYLLFESRRRQRVIPVIEPLRNTTLEFIGTIGNLYYVAGDHRNLAEKKILFFLELVRSRYGIKGKPGEPDFDKSLAVKSGHAESEIAAVTRLITQIRARKHIEAGELMELNRKIEQLDIQP